MHNSVHSVPWAGGPATWPPAFTKLYLSSNCSHSVVSLIFVRQVCWLLYIFVQTALYFLIEVSNSFRNRSKNIPQSFNNSGKVPQSFRKSSKFIQSFWKRSSIIPEKFLNNSGKFQIHSIIPETFLNHSEIIQSQFSPLKS